jgi:uracil phosphoribosyltransferase
MLFGALQLLPKSKVGFVGLQRDEQTAVASEYYWKLPPLTKKSVVIITSISPLVDQSCICSEWCRKKIKELRVVCVILCQKSWQF